MTYIVNWKDPYAAKGKYWLKGNLHTHTNLSGCGCIPTEEVLSIYEKMGYSFLAITDHCIVSSPRSYKTKLIMLSGVEADFSGAKHMGITAVSEKNIRYSKKTPQQRLIDLHKNNALVILNHPDWQETEHYPIDMLCGYKNYHGIEIYNTVIERLTGSALSTAKWDRLLGNGRKVLGFANQDSHKYTDYIDCCNVAHVDKKTPQAVFNALRTGNFYCYYGVTIENIGRKDNTIFVSTKDAGEIRFIGTHGVILKKVKGRKAEMTFDDHDRTKYIRVECYGNGAGVSWSQPFFKSN